MVDEKTSIAKSYFDAILWHDAYTRVVLKEPFNILLGDVTFHLESANKEKTSGCLSFPTSGVIHVSEKIETIKNEIFKKLEGILFLNGVTLEVTAWGGVKLFNPNATSPIIIEKIELPWNVFGMPVGFSGKELTVISQMHSKLQKSKDKEILYRILSLLVTSNPREPAAFPSVWTAFNCVYRFHQKTREKPDTAAKCSKAPGGEQKAICMFAEAFSYCEEGGTILKRHHSAVESLLCGEKQDEQNQDKNQARKNTAEQTGIQDLWRQIFLGIYCMRNRLTHEGVPDENLDGASKLLQDVILAYLKNLVCDDSQENFLV